MLNILNLIRNEAMKLTHKIGTWVMVLLMVVLIIAMGLIIKSTSGGSSDANWKENLKSQNEAIKQAQSQPQGKDSRINITIGYDTKTLKLNEYRIEHNIPPVDTKTLWGFVSSAAGAVSLITLFTIVIGGGMVANEFSQGTIKLLLIRPSKRWKILLSKYITVLLYTVVMVIILFVISFLVGGVLFSFNGVNQPYLNYVNDKVVETNMVLHTFSTYGYSCVDLIMMVTFAFTISTLFRNSSMAIGLSVFLMFAGQTMVALLISFGKSAIAKYILFANTDLTQYTNGTPLIQGTTMKFSIIVLIVYYIAFTLISFLGFAKRDVAA